MNEPDRTWENLSDYELEAILETNPTRKIKRIAAKELKKRMSGKSVDVELAHDGSGGQVVITAIRISHLNFLKLFWCGLPAIILTAVTIWLVVLVMNLWLLGLIVKDVENQMEPWQQSGSQVQRNLSR